MNPHVVGVCATCCGDVVRTPGEGARCGCDDGVVIPQAFFDAASRLAGPHSPLVPRARPVPTPVVGRLVAELERVAGERDRLLLERGEEDHNRLLVEHAELADALSRALERLAARPLDPAGDRRRLTATIQRRDATITRLREERRGLPAAQETVGSYRLGDDLHRLVLATEGEGRALYDTGPAGSRLVERFGKRVGLLEIAAVAGDYIATRAAVVASSS